MDISEILSDALVYPLNNIKALLIFLVLGIVAGIAVSGTVTAIYLGIEYDDFFALIGSGILGIIITLIVGFIIGGYELDIIKSGIERNIRAPGIDLVRQFINGIKLFVVNIVYFIIPIIIGSILAIVFQHWLSGLLTAIFFIFFALSAVMAHCRLAKTEDLTYALTIGEAIGDIARVGFVKIIVFIVAIFIVAFVLMFIVNLINSWNAVVGGILMGILGVYLTFFSSRALGLLYSDV